MAEAMAAPMAAAMAAPMAAAIAQRHWPGEAGGPERRL